MLSQFPQVLARSCLRTLSQASKKIQDGCTGIESDLHITKDGVIVMFHDPTLDRVTNGTGRITQSNWKGELEHLRTTQQPSQPLTRLPEVLALVQQPGNEHVVLNLDIKPTSEPSKLFTAVRRDLEAAGDETGRLSERIILGLWHPRYIQPAKKLLPECRRIHITRSINLSRQYFWNDVHGFSVNISCLMGADGERFRAQAAKAGKGVYTWTVNDRSEMIAAMDMGLKAIMTDKPGSLKALQQECSEDWPKVKAELGYTFGWFTPRYYSVVDRYRGRAFEALLRYAAGSFDGKGGTPPASSFAL